MGRQPAGGQEVPQAAVGASATALVTGASISLAQPAGLSGGSRLRVALVHLLFDGARPLFEQETSREHRMVAFASDRKLEVVLGRAAGSRRCPRPGVSARPAVDVPNEAHLLAALHLLHGGTDLTLNFDIGGRARRRPADRAGKTTGRRGIGVPGRPA